MSERLSKRFLRKLVIGSASASLQFNLTRPVLLKFLHTYTPPLGRSNITLDHTMIPKFLWGLDAYVPKILTPRRSHARGS